MLLILGLSCANLFLLFRLWWNGRAQRKALSDRLETIARMLGRPQR